MKQEIIISKNINDTFKHECIRKATKSESGDLYYTFVWKGRYVLVRPGDKLIQLDNGEWDCDYCDTE